MKRAYKFRAYPTCPQQAHAVRLLADHCDLYNAALEERREAWRMRRASISYGSQSSQLRVASMTRRPRPKPDPARPGGYLPNQAAAKAGLNRSVLDAGWAQFTRILVSKAEEAGRRVVLVNPAGTSIGCHVCGRRCFRPRQDTVVCPVHGPMDADVNGARNVYARAGLGSGRAAQAA